MIIDIYKDKDISDLMPLLLEADPSTESIKSYIETSVIFTGSINKNVVGVVVLNIDNYEVDINNIVVKKEYRCRGIGRGLMTHILDFSKDILIKIITVGTGNSSLIQLKFYQQFGFRIVGIIQNYFDEYPEPIYENGIRCRDLVRLELII